LGTITAEHRENDGEKIKEVRVREGKVKEAQFLQKTNTQRRTTSEK